jgi:hypothetical protein
MSLDLYAEMCKQLTRYESSPDLPQTSQEGEGGVHARYALLGTRSAGDGRRPGDRLGAVPIGPPLALAASRGPGLTHGRLPQPVNGERVEG